ncbi:ATP-binding protein [Bacillus sp. 31A1R]|uniref:histidine kinase n=1 Tax=Robertmurraya mangrovi TaxID=3098077 RepID=A0ABU5IWX1_9BACI|nr:ATP-binding protein [Bacillus sp. 31A1R]MDZ5471630.1 ATP-binding protein [Bacillus sp. 31A1R]
MRFATRLYLGFSMIIIVMGALLFMFVYLLSNQNQQINSLVEDRYKKIKLINQLRVEIRSIDRELNAFVNESNRNNDIEHIQKLKESKTSLSEGIETLGKILKIKEAKEQWTILDHQFKSYEPTVDQIITLLISGETKNIRAYLQESENRRENIINTTERLIKIQEKVMEDTIYESRATYTMAVNMGIAFTIIGIVLGILLAIWVTRIITTRLKTVKDVMKSIDYTQEILPRIPIHNKDEIAEIAEAYNEMATQLEVHEKYEREYMGRIEEENWLKTSIAELSMASQGLMELETLGDSYMRIIVPRVGATYGSLYLMTKSIDKPFLSKLITYAGPDQSDPNSVPIELQLGEGLVGQCAVDHQIKILEDVPSDYIKISSSLGDSKPRNIIILPIILDDELLGVIELAGINTFSELQMNLLEQTSVHLGTSINRIQRQMLVRELLEESQALNEELQSQSEELQLQQEELRTMNEELESQYKHSEQKTLDLEKAKTALEEKTRQVLLSSQYKSEFLANMSHELRTPLNSLLILAKMLVDNKESNLTEKQKEYASTIHSAGKELLQLINDILDLSKIEAGKEEIQVGEMDIRDILTFAEKQFKPIAEQKQIEFKVLVDDEVPGIIYSDEQKVYQILKNLLSNAFKFTNTGLIELTVKRHERVINYGKELGPMISLSVKDTGIGIPAEKHNLIFEAFQQADGTTSRKYGGTGLGLSISRELSGLIGGSITLQSKEGKGSTFTLYIPENLEYNDQLLVMKEVAATEELQVTESNLSLLDHLQESKPMEHLSDNTVENEKVLEGKSILVVDDDMRNVFALTTALEDAGMLVTFAENGIEAIDSLNENPNIDAVLMDIMMPEMDGYEAMRKIREIIEFEDLPIIALTAKAMKNDRQKCIDAGASDYISKPVNIDQLLSLLKVWLYK